MQSLLEEYVKRIENKERRNKDKEDKEGDKRGQKLDSSIDNQNPKKSKCC